MIWFYINSIDRSLDVQHQSLLIENESQQRASSCNFTVFQNAKPSDNQDLKIYLGDTIASAAGATLTLDGNITPGRSIFYSGQKLWIRIGDSDEEEVEVSTYTETTNTLVLTTAPSGTVSGGDKIGEIRFGGVISRVEEVNMQVLSQLEYNIEGVDYSKNESDEVRRLKYENAKLKKEVEFLKKATAYFANLNK